MHRLGVGAGEKGGELTGRNPTDRGKLGTKYHLLCDANGLPLHALLTGANTHDSMLFELPVLAPLDDLDANRLGGLPPTLGKRRDVTWRRAARDA